MTARWASFFFVVSLPCLASTACRESRISNSKKPSIQTKARPSRDRQVANAWTRHLQQIKVHAVEHGHVTEKSISLQTALHAAWPKAGPDRFIQVFASYCPPCLKEIPGFNQLQKEGAGVFGLSLDTGDHPSLLRSIKTHQPLYPIGLITSMSLEKLNPVLDGLPMTLILDQQDQVRTIVYGQVNAKQLREFLRQ